MASPKDVLSKIKKEQFNVCECPKCKTRSYIEISVIVNDIISRGMTYLLPQKLNANRKEVEAECIKSFKETALKSGVDQLPDLKFCYGISDFLATYDTDGAKPGVFGILKKKVEVPLIYTIPAKIRELTRDPSVDIMAHMGVYVKNRQRIFDAWNEYLRTAEKDFYSAGRKFADAKMELTYDAFKAEADFKQTMLKETGIQIADDKDVLGLIYAENGELKDPECVKQELLLMWGYIRYYSSLGVLPPV
ncbi:MAG: hypothetical protein JW778_04685 [Candidatus Altiarchaeota archaeon]|nr:hypothetical protein [Candidatus Altiarchaeota archaeon]